MECIEATKAMEIAHAFHQEIEAKLETEALSLVNGYISKGINLAANNGHQHESFKKIEGNKAEEIMLKMSRKLQELGYEVEWGDKDFLVSWEYVK